LAASLTKRSIPVAYYLISIEKSDPPLTCNELSKQFNNIELKKELLLYTIV